VNNIIALSWKASLDSGSTATQITLSEIPGKGSSANPDIIRDGLDYLHLQNTILSAGIGRFSLPARQYLEIRREEQRLSLLSGTG